MISDALPYVLNATGGLLVADTDEGSESRLHFTTCAWPRKFGMERFRLVLSRPVTIDEVIDAIEQVCTEQGASMERETSYELFQGSDKGMITIYTPGGSSFQAMVFLDDTVIDFRPLVVA